MEIAGIENIIPPLTKLIRTMSSVSDTTFGSEEAFEDGWGMKRTLTGVRS